MPMKSRSPALAAILVIALCIVGAVVWGLAQSGVRATDDAFVDANVIAVAAEVPGRVASLRARDNQRVERGDELLDIDPQDLKLKVDEATAAKAAADADQDSASGAPEARKRGAKAGVDLAQARLAQARLMLDKARLTAPASGYVTRRAVSEGSYVRPGEPLFAIVEPGAWITANLKETQLQGVEPGAAADIRIDAYPGLRLKGHVESVQHGAGQAFSLIPADNASGNFVKVVQRVPVKVVLDSDPGRPLGPGLSAHVRIHAK